MCAFLCICFSRSIRIPFGADRLREIQRKTKAIEHVAVALASGQSHPRDIAADRLYGKPANLRSRKRARRTLRLCQHGPAANRLALSGSNRVSPGHDLADDWRTQLEEDQLRPDAYVLALAICLCFVCHNRIV